MTNSANQITPDNDELRVVVFGKNGHGKSTVGNALLERDHFPVGTTSETADIAECSKAGRTIKVVDTPDVTSAGKKRKEKQAEVDKWKDLAAPYASILLLVIRADTPYTEQDFIVYRQIRRFWGGRGSTKEKLMVVFTFAEGQDADEVGERMEKDSPKWMGKVMADACGRFIVLKGKASGNFVDEVTSPDSDDEEDDEGGDDEEKKEKMKKARGGRGRRLGHYKRRRGRGQGHGRFPFLYCCLCELLCK